MNDDIEKWLIIYRICCVALFMLLLWIIFSYCHQNKNKTISICRKTLPSLKASVLRDFLEILRSNELYSELL